MAKDPTQTAPDDASRCPLCSADNQCAAVAGSSVNACWCFSASFPDCLLDKVPETDRGVRCICQRCVESEREQRGEG